MRLEDCIDGLFNGKKLRRSSWLSHQYIHLNNGELLWWHDGLSASLSWFLQQGDTDWGFYDEARMDIPDAFWEMVDPKWNYLAMDSNGVWKMSICGRFPKEGDEACFDDLECGPVVLRHFTWYKEPEDWTKTLYKRPGAE